MEDNLDQYDKLRELFTHFSDKPIVYFPIYSKITGSVSSGVLLAQVIYWGKKYPEFYKTDQEFSDELAMGLYELRAAKDKLVKLGLIETKRKGIPAKTHYFIDIDNIINLITSLRKNRKLANGKTVNLHKEKPKTNTESTTEINTKTTISKDIVIRVSDETQNDLNKKTPRRVKREPEQKQVRRRKPPVKNILPPYVKNIIEKWNSYPSTTNHKLDIEKPSGTIKSIHRYLIQLKTGKMSGLKESWIRNSKIPRSFLARKWTEEEILQGIEHLSKFSQNDYWPKDGKDNFKNLSNLLYNMSTKKSLFLKVMNSPPEKISVQMKIIHPDKVERFMKADIWANDNKPSEQDLDRQLDSMVKFFVYLRPYVAPTEACMGYDLSHGETPKLHTYFYDNYISFLENTPIMLKNANPQPLSSVGWAFKAYIADIWDDLPHIDSVINPVKLLEKFNNGDK